MSPAGSNRSKCPSSEKLISSFHAAACGVLLCCLPLVSQTASWRSTTQQAPWADKGTISSTAWSGSGVYMEPLPDSQYQIIEGFGGCFNEKGWDALSVLSPAGRDSVIRALFDSSGCNFTTCRYPVGASDFANDYYSLNDSANDYDMSNLNLVRDRVRLIPFVKAAMLYQPKLQIWGSPWSPPQWMKTTGLYSGDGHLKQDQQTLTAYALYLAKAVAAFKAEGMNFGAICAQNEPTQWSNYPSGVWTPAEYRSFYRNYLIPRFTKDNIKADLMWGTYCCGTYDEWIKPAMADSVIFRNVPILGIQNSVPGWAQSASSEYPSKRIFETETHCCTGNDWAGGYVQYSLLYIFLLCGASVYSQWNMVLDETGLSGWGWAQSSMITVNKTTRAVTYNPHFYAAKHFSNAIKPNARCIKLKVTDGVFKGEAIAFRNPNGDIVFVTSSTAGTAQPLTIKLADRVIKATLPANSFNTFTIKQTTSNRGPVMKHSGEPVVFGMRNATLFFSVPSAAAMDEMEFALYDLGGRTVWSAHRAGTDLHAGTQTIAVRSATGGMHSGAYFLEMKVRNSAPDCCSTQKMRVTIVR